MNQVQSVQIRAPPVSDDAYFDNLEQAIRFTQMQTEGDEAVPGNPFFPLDISENEPVLPKARKAGPLEKTSSSKFYFEDANAELTLNLLKIRPQEEVKLVRQSNSEFFEQLQKKGEECDRRLSQGRRDSLDLGNWDDLDQSQHQSTSDSEQSQHLPTDGQIPFEQAMNTCGPFSDVTLGQSSNISSQFMMSSQLSRPSDNSVQAKKVPKNPFSRPTQDTYTEKKLSEVYKKKQDIHLLRLSDMQSEQYENSLIHQTMLSEASPGEFLNSVFENAVDSSPETKFAMASAGNQVTEFEPSNQTIFALNQVQSQIYTGQNAFNQMIHPNFVSNCSNQNGHPSDQMSHMMQYPQMTNQNVVDFVQQNCHQQYPSGQSMPDMNATSFQPSFQSQSDVLANGYRGAAEYQRVNPSESMKSQPKQISSFSEHGLQQFNNQRKINQGNNINRFTVDLGRIMRGEDPRTTIMIRHIPNKYNQKMLLEKIDQLHAGRYDFFYLPIDLKNNCNVGYAFINFVDPIFIIPFYEDLNGKSWERFNSEKICEITYGRIQGKQHLDDNFSCQAETRKIKPLILEAGQFDSSDIDAFRQSLLASCYSGNQYSMSTYPKGQHSWSNQKRF